MMYLDENVSKQFKQIFNVEMERFCIKELTVLKHKFYFDVVAFDSYLKRCVASYEDNKTSMKMFVCARYGKKAVEFVEMLLEKY